MSIYNTEFGVILGSRINRARYFWFSALIFLVLQTIDFCMEGATVEIFIILSWLAILLSFILAFCQFMIDVRRLHDLNKTGGLAILLLIYEFIFSVIITGSWVLMMPLLIARLLLIFMKGTAGPNKYGPDPGEYPNDSDYLKELKRIAFNK